MYILYESCVIIYDKSYMVLKIVEVNNFIMYSIFCCIIMKKELCIIEVNIIVLYEV